MVAGDATGDAGDTHGANPLSINQFGRQIHKVTGRNRARLKRGKIAPRELHTSLTRLYAGLADF